MALVINSWPMHKVYYEKRTRSKPQLQSLPKLSNDAIPKAQQHLTSWWSCMKTTDYSIQGVYLKTTPSLTILANQENAHQSWQFYHHLSSLAQIILNSNHFKDSNIFFPLLVNDSNHLSLLWPYEPYISHIAKEGFFLLFWFLPLFLFLICEILCFSGSRQAKHVCTGKTGWTQNVKTFLSLRKEKGNSFFELAIGITIFFIFMLTL